MMTLFGRRAVVAAGVVALVTSLACRDRGTVAADFQPGPVPAEYAAGEQLFTATCARCHGVLAVGTEQGPPLVHIYYEPNHHGDVAFDRAVQLGVVQHHWNFGPMPPVAGVTPEQARTITAYVRWLQRQAGIGVE